MTKKMQTMMKCAMLLTLLLGLSQTVMAAEEVEVGDISLTDVSMGGRLVRMGNNGLILGSTGMSLKGTVGMKINGYEGRRLICMLQPLTEKDEVLEDKRGDLMNLIPFIVEGDGACAVEVKVPYGWLDLSKKPKTIHFGVTILDNKGDALAQKVVVIETNKMKINGNVSPERMLGEMMSGDGSGSDDDSGGGLLGGLLGGMFGGSSATAEHICSACDGTKLCPACEGDAFFDPDICRRCSRDPGFCRRCKGTGKESVNVSY